MSSIVQTDLCYQAATRFKKSAEVERWEVFDAHLEQVVSAITEAIRVLRSEQLELSQWDELVSQLRLSRWRLTIAPYPLAFSVSDQELGQQTIEGLGGAVLGHAGNEEAVLVNAVEQLGRWLADLDAVPGVGQVLVDALADWEFKNCMIAVAHAKVAEPTERWLKTVTDHRMPIVGPAQVADRAVTGGLFAVGIPARFPASITSAPRAKELFLIHPRWVTDVELATSMFSEVAEGVIRPTVRVNHYPDQLTVQQEFPELPEATQMDLPLVPEPLWQDPGPQGRPLKGQIKARRYLLAGGMGVYLDEQGGTVRSLNLDNPSRDRVEYLPLGAIQVGTFLVFREGQTESQALYDKAIRALGKEGQKAADLQKRWKQALTARIDLVGDDAAGVVLRRRGVSAYHQVLAWAEPYLVRPRSDHDFELLLDWLGIPNDPTIEAATKLRKARAIAAQQVRHELEEALADLDVTELLVKGHVEQEWERDGFAAISARQVIAISPYEQNIGSWRVRQQFPDPEALWLS